MATRDAGLTKEQVEAAEVHAAGSSHCGEIKSKSAFSRYSTTWAALDVYQAFAFTTLSHFTSAAIDGHGRAAASLSVGPCHHRWGGWVAVHGFTAW
jgi:hypothetical protein